MFSRNSQRPFIVLLPNVYVGFAKTEIQMYVLLRRKVVGALDVKMNLTDCVYVHIAVMRMWRFRHNTYSTYNTKKQLQQENANAVCFPQCAIQTIGGV